MKNKKFEKKPTTAGMLKALFDFLERISFGYSGPDTSRLQVKGKAKKAITLEKHVNRRIK